MSARSEILQKIRSVLPPVVDTPASEYQGIEYPDPAAKFAEVLAGVGGQCVRVRTFAEAQAWLEAFGPYKSSGVRLSCVPGVGANSFDLAAVEDPHDLEHVEYVVLPGDVAVAENGAVWVTDAQVPQRVLYFLTQHLALVAPAGRVVSNMHQGYAAVPIGTTHFGAWLSGPSKTADIEQSLVIGAHGATSLVVFLVDEWDASPA